MNLHEETKCNGCERNGRCSEQVILNYAPTEEELNRLFDKIDADDITDIPEDVLEAVTDFAVKLMFASIIDNLSDDLDDLDVFFLNI